MVKLRGVISDRIRKIFPAGDIAYNPPRPGLPAKPMKLKKGQEGQSITGRKKK